MAFEMIVGLFVLDHERYAQHRAEIAPLLQVAGGKFRYDPEVARMLKTEVEHDINHLFVIHFPDRARKERFFADPHCLEIRARLFEKAVGARAIIAEYEASRGGGTLSNQLSAWCRWRLGALQSTVAG